MLMNLKLRTRRRNRSIEMPKLPADNYAFVPVTPPDTACGLRWPQVPSVFEFPIRRAASSALTPVIGSRTSALSYQSAAPQPVLDRAGAWFG